MSDVERLNIALTADMAARVRQAVAAGEYASTSEVVQDALQAWERDRARRDQARAELDRLWDEGVNSGPAEDAADVVEDLGQRIGRRAGSRGTT